MTRTRLMKWDRWLRNFADELQPQPFHPPDPVGAWATEYENAILSERSDMWDLMKDQFDIYGGFYG